MAEPRDMIIPMLSEMRAENATNLDAVAVHLEKIEATQVSFWHAPNTDSLLSWPIAGDVQGRMETSGNWARRREGRA